MSIDHAPPIPLPPRFSDSDLRAARSVIVENVARAFVAGEIGSTTDLAKLTPHVRQELEDKLRALSFHTDPAARWSAWEDLVHEVTQQQLWADGDLDMATIPAHLRDHHETVTAYLSCHVGDAVNRLVGGS